jgi:hypothetical protein
MSDYWCCKADFGMHDGECVRRQLTEATNALRARIAQLEEALEGLVSYTRNLDPPRYVALKCADAALSTPPGEGTQGWLEEQRRLAKIEALESIPCRLNGIVPPNCNDLDLTGKCLRCAALVELRQGEK